METMNKSGAGNPEGNTGAAAEDGVKTLSASRFFTAAVIAAVGLGILRRFLFGLDTPLWLDEAYTGAVAMQPTFRGLIDDSLNDVPPPLFYSLMWAWEKLFGPGNLSLRLPSLFFSVLAPLLILWRGHPDRFTRYMWAAFAALWIPGFFHATDARAYALLFLLGTVQITFFMRMVSAPTLRKTLWWAGLSALFLLTHYHALVVTGLQGLGYLFLRRKEALRTWPAALLFTPVAAWMAFHLPLVARFSKPEVAWQKLLGPADLLQLPGFLLALPRFSFAVLAVIVVSTGWELWRRRGSRGEPGVAPAEAWAVMASIFSIGLIFALGFLSPNFTPRYLMPFVPGALLGAAIWARLLTQRFPKAQWVILGGLVLSVAWETSIRARQQDWRADLTWEIASRHLAAQGARRLIFAWDHPTAAVTPPGLTARVGSFFFARAGKPIPVIPVRLAGRDVDPNLVLSRTAARPGDAVIWVYELHIPRTLAVRYPPAISKLDRRFTCRKYGGYPRAVLACLNRGGGDTRAPSPADVDGG